jgi:hypothetical protein
MSVAFTRRTHRTAARLLAWCLMCTVAICGFASTRFGLLGTNHVHTQATQVAAAMAGWQDFRRAAHVAGGAAPRQHTHALLQRHRHAPQEAGVVSIDAEGSAAVSGEASGGSSPPAVAMLALDTLFEGAARSGTATRWPDSATRGIERIEAGRLERPPRG